LTRAFTLEEISYLERYLDGGYKLFKNRVAKVRKLSETQVEAIAQGLVYSGEDALKIKLIDVIGGIDKAISKAAQMA
ncbi:UNVERIFIED_CONTAM: S49 family peptidase, partial [Prevotella sp. 15_C9]